MNYKNKSKKYCTIGTKFITAKRKRKIDMHTFNNIKAVYINCTNFLKIYLKIYLKDILKKCI